jgi:carbonic anhydrase/acetyltransferase-like protein (isoleucine patch superfamily)
MCLGGDTENVIIVRRVLILKNKVLHTTVGVIDEGYRQG